MKLLILSEYFYPDKSSTPKVLTELAEDIVKNGIDVDVITSDCSYRGQNSDLKSEEVYEGINIKRVYSSKFNRNKALGRITNYLTFLVSAFINTILKKDYDYILLVSNPPILPLIGYLVNKIRKKPYIYLLHDIYPDMAVKVGAIKDDGLICKVMTAINKKIYNNAHKVIVLGKDMKQNLLNKKVPEDKIEIITNWADKEKIYKISKVNEFSIKNNIDDTFNIIYTGNIGRFHDIETILKAAYELKKVRNIKFIFVGDGYKKKDIEAYVEKFRLENIKIFDYQYGETYNQLLNSADLFITTLDKGIEGLGVPSKTYSYLAAGKPIIAIMNKDSEIGSLVEGNKLGIRVDSGEVIRITNFILSMNRELNLYKDIQNNVEDIFNNNYERNIVTVKFVNIMYRNKLMED
ncbi:MAG: glycosyltransferase family 4 protein [Paeniclostridium sordellii]|uniref:Glycosyltransferase family 4 protein n=1 Tax=Paeniclostridium hominis TaxID=2764329 RepID=A0ABR7K4F6_9FIRM|nr:MULTISPECIES: glycosyltransferase family 4 protein [Paeniclostridium]MBC6003815.1 glycosyltransferase family 4 protein [Paeniclostridium hominis]MDU2592525.1 glycosyltransferase family 4 protein [Paeniclostridium sordellii]